MVTVSTVTTAAAAVSAAVRRRARAAADARRTVERRHQPAAPRVTQLPSNYRSDSWVTDYSQDDPVTARLLAEADGATPPDG